MKIGWPKTPPSNDSDIEQALASVEKITVGENVKVLTQIDVENPSGAIPDELAQVLANLAKNTA